MREYYELYMRCFPDYPTTPENFSTLLRPELAHIIERRDNSRLIGCALVHNNCVPMLCVDSEYRGQGIGSGILEDSEGYLRGQGAEKIVLGCGEHYMLQGVPEGPAVQFFEKHGYSAGWTSINMALELSEFNADKLDIPSAPDGVGYRFAKKQDISPLLKAVEAAEVGWVNIFNDCSDPVLLAELDGTIAGFEVLSTDGGYFTTTNQLVGSVGCVGVVPHMRERGIGLEMVSHGVQWLKEQGCDVVELRYTWLESWYGKLGFKTVSRQWMGEKTL